ncbi:response regulator [Niabella pedocola]|uniref:Response regulator n=1 Tax=Niabella pedocola TaxID=1752077 RepID=A0ABS8PM16_9BACT|nr:response regulator [Niabella pedocola]MCD2422143.1 response regulator [Niabella pedocola]
MTKILLIEDNPEIRENMTEILELAGYEVFTAPNGKEGIDTAIRKQPNLILCDIMMPVLDGYGVLHMVQKLPQLQSVPFIFLTAKSERNEIRKGMESGADDYITKPFDSIELLNAIEMRLKKAELLKQSFQGNLEGVNALISVNYGKDYLEELRKDRNINRYKKKQLIYSEGNHPSRVYYIQKGKVKAFKRNDDGKELIVGLYAAGDFLGYLPLMEGRTYRETAEAMEDVEVSIIPRAEFEELIGSNPVVMKKFMGILARNVDEKAEQLLAVAYNSLRKKVADTLVTLNRKYNKDQDEGFHIDLSRENLAAIAGVAKESLIRMLSELKDEHLINLEGRKIRILNYAKLEDMFN